MTKWEDNLDQNEEITVLQDENLGGTMTDEIVVPILMQNSQVQVEEPMHTTQEQEMVRACVWRIYL